jgi:hypothetical protein
MADPGEIARDRDRLPPPGPSFLRPQVIRIGQVEGHVGMTRPTTVDGWWLAVLWVAGERGIGPFRELAPAAGPPPEPPLVRLGPALTGALSGLIAEEDGRLAIRLAPGVDTGDPSRPWDAPAVIRAAFKFEPLRASTMRESELADAVLQGFRRAVAGLAHR